jgi:hypothetical protein
MLEDIFSEAFSLLEVDHLTTKKATLAAAVAKRTIPAKMRQNETNLY